MTNPDELESLARAATPGPWRSIIDDTGGERSGWPLCIVPENYDDRTVVRTGGMWPYEWDAKVSQHEAVSTAAFIAAANPVTVRALLSANREMREALERFLWWGEQQCPCYDDKPNPCPLCGASVENLEGCKAIEAKFPPDILRQARSALTTQRRDGE